MGCVKNLYGATKNQAKGYKGPAIKRKEKRQLKQEERKR